MKDDLKKKLNKRLHPALLPRKKRFLLLMFTGLPAGFVYALISGTGVKLAALFTALAGVVVLGGFALEIVSDKGQNNKKAAIESGEYYTSDKWREKYEKYAGSHEFETVRTKTMKADLDRRFLRPAGIVFILFSLVFFLPSVFWKSGDIAINVILAVTGGIFLLWGIMKLRRTPVRAFLRSCGDELPYIERSYLNGRMLSFHYNGLKSENSGINIGGNYTVVYNQTEIRAIDNRCIKDVSKKIRHIKNYKGGIYTGSETENYLIIGYTDSENNELSFRIWLNEFQVEMAYRALSSAHSETSYDEHINNEI
ncbi:MAG TPA: hypothetical protein P5092_01420 [Ruminococcus sp.]|nr:hypothetical protein [Ruminococcus sp.]